MIIIYIFVKIIFKMLLLMKDLQDKLLDLMPLVYISNDKKSIFFRYEDIEQDHVYDYITESEYYHLIKKLMNMMIEIVNTDIKSLDRDFENDIFPQLIKELRKEKLEKILRR